MLKFIFKDYEFNHENSEAVFNYEFNNGFKFSEKIKFSKSDSYNKDILDRALKLAFLVIGVSYYKCFPTTECELNFDIDEFQADFLNHVYRNGLGQFIYENKLSIHDMVDFKVDISAPNRLPEVNYSGEGIISLQSGGKDSLLTASLLSKKSIKFDSLYVSSSDKYPKILDRIGGKMHVVRRYVDIESIKSAISNGGLNGHVPITYIIQAISLIQAILLNKSTILTSIAHEGEEPHVYVEGMPITHQWSKTYKAEILFADYVRKYVSKEIMIGSPLRSFSELKVAKLFVENAWKNYGYDFSSCNIANYKQGSDNSNLKWCGQCSKCANSYLLFAPFLDKKELVKLFSGNDLFIRNELQDDFKGLLGIDNFIKPFECVGEISELRRAYNLAIKNNQYGRLSFEVSDNDFDLEKKFESQTWATELVS